MDRTRGFVHPSSIADSPVFLPMRIVEPSPTTGALNQHVIPPLFHSSLARPAPVASSVDVLNKQHQVAAFAPAPAPVEAAMSGDLALGPEAVSPRIRESIACMRGERRRQMGSVGNASVKWAAAQWSEK
jgi:hypothetical protein